MANTKHRLAITALAATIMLAGCTISEPDSIKDEGEYTGKTVSLHPNSKNTGRPVATETTVPNVRNEPLLSDEDKKLPVIPGFMDSVPIPDSPLIDACNKTETTAGFVKLVSLLPDVDSLNAALIAGDGNVDETKVIVTPTPAPAPSPSVLPDETTPNPTPSPVLVETEMVKLDSLGNPVNNGELSTFLRKYFNSDGFNALKAARGLALHAQINLCDSRVSEDGSFAVSLKANKDDGPGESCGKIGVLKGFIRDDQIVLDPYDGYILTDKSNCFEDMSVYGDGTLKWAS